MSQAKWNFDDKAADWDKNPGRVKLTTEISNAISGEGILSPNMNVLDFGCGTGLLALRLAPLVHTVTGVDSSKGMLAVLRSKIEEHHISNIKVSYRNTEEGDVLEGAYDVVVCGMTLHHVANIRPLLGQFHRVLVPGGCLVVADLDSDNGEFHGENDTVFHHGFNRELLRGVLVEAGFDKIRERTAASVTKPTADGTLRSFSVFLMTGRK